MIVIDTDIAIDVLRKFPPALAWAASQPAQDFVISGFTGFELFAGCHDARQRNAVDAMVKRFQLAWPSVPHCENALDVYRAQHLSHGLGALDSLIAQTALNWDIRSTPSTSNTSSTCRGCGRFSRT
jgi:predicted nucleic acid-binding protein